MQFLKRHYEKIILSVVLLALAASAVWLSMAISQAKLEPEFHAGPPPKTPWKGVDLTALRKTLQDMREPPTLVLSGEHNLFNPAVWKMKADGTLFKMTIGGPAALSVTDIRPFFYQILFDEQTSSGFYMVVWPANSRPKPHQFSHLDEKPTPTRPYKIVGVGTNAANGMVTLQLQIPETQETVSVTTNQPYRRVEGYEVDLKYSASDDKKTFTKKKLNDNLPLSGDPYQIIGITSNSVTVQDVRTQQKTSIEWNGGH